MTAPTPPDLPAARARLRALAVPEQAEAAAVVLAELDVAQARARELDTAEAERELRRLVRGDRSRMGRAVTLVLDELDRVRGTTPAVPVRRAVAPPAPPEPAPPGDRPA